jgi:hypothetical protein
MDIAQKLRSASQQKPPADRAGVSSTYAVFRSRQKHAIDDLASASTASLLVHRSLRRLVSGTTRIFNYRIGKSQRSHWKKVLYAKE